MRIPRFKENWDFWLIMLIAVAFRFLFLSIKPPHFDEGIDGWWIDQMYALGYYPYDPTNYHGPIPFYFLFFCKLFFGRTIFALRLPAVIFGTGTVYLMTQFKDMLGKNTSYIAALLVAVSPAMTFYSRYTPHEVGLLFFSVLSCLGFIRFIDKRDSLSLWQMGLGVMGMISTKETFSIHLVCFGLALICLKVYENFFKLAGQSPKGPKGLLVSQNFTNEDLRNSSLVSILLFVIFYTGFFVHWSGIVDFFRSFEAWVHTGTGGSGHDKPLNYWFKLFTHYEWAGFVGLVLSFKILVPILNSNNFERSSHWLRFFAIYGLGIFVAYSIIPYKTPWCVMQLLWPFFFIAASILSDLSRHEGLGKRLAQGGVVVLTLLGVVESYKINFIKETDENEPYVYVQTFPEIMEIDHKLRILTDDDINNHQMVIKIYMEDTWPLSWLWGDYTKIAWLSNGGFDKPDAPLILVDISKRGQIESHLQGDYYFQVFRLRSAQGETVAYFDKEKFRKFFNENSPLFHGVAK